MNSIDLFGKYCEISVLLDEPDISPWLRPASEISKLGLISHDECLSRYIEFLESLSNRDLKLAQNELQRESVEIRFLAL